MKTVLVTGCSSGFGLAIARDFLERGWRVVATMRNPKEGLLPASDRLTLLPLDVTDAASIARAVAAAGPIDVLVNNAGIGFLNALEATPVETARALFETNVLGLVAMTQAVVPAMRERGAGVIVHIGSSVTLKPLPLLSVYSASKHAVNGFSTALAEELAAFGIRVVTVLPGRAPATRFGENAMALLPAENPFPAPYAPLVEAFMAGFSDESAPSTSEEDVVAAVRQAVEDPAAPRLIPAGADAVELAG